MTPEEALFRLFADLPREGPGSDAATREALRRLGLPDGAGHAGRTSLPRRVLDLGCGSGRQTLVVASALGVPITAVDRHAPFLARLQAAAAAAGVGHLVRTACIDFGALDRPAGDTDLLWSEGAIWAVGWREGLGRWRRFMTPGGHAAVTEATWLTPTAPPEAIAFWRESYPAMATVDANVAAARTAGWETVDTFTLPSSAWWDDYYRPLERRIAALAPEAERDESLAAALAESRREIALYARHGDAYGYVFYLLRAA